MPILWFHRVLQSPLVQGAMFVLALAVVAPADNEPFLFSDPTPEDYLWIQGEMDRLPSFTKARYLQRVLLHDVARKLFPHEPHLITQCGIVLHLINTLILFCVFIQFHRTLGRTRRGFPPPAMLGAVGAGWIFYFNRSMAHLYISALAYLLVTLFTLLSLHFLLLFLRRRLAVYWAGVLISYCLGIASHSFAMGLPLFWLACEVSHAASRNGRWLTRKTVARYAIAVAIPLTYLFLNWGLYSQTLKEKGQGGLRIIQFFPDYLAYLLLRYVSDTTMLEMMEAFPEHLFRTSGFILLLGILIMASKRTPGLGIWRAMSLFIIAWAMVSFPFAILSPQTLGKAWRYYFPVIGLALLAGYFLAWAAQRLLKRAQPTVWGAIILLAIVAVPVQQILAGKNGISTMLRISRNELPLDRRMKKCPGVLWCTEVQRLSNVEEVKAILAGNRDLACKNLRGLDLSGLDLSGADLRSANLSGIRARGTKFVGADMRRACLNLSIFSEADFTNARLDHGQMDASVFEQTTFGGTSMPRLTLVGSIFHTCVFRDADLTGLWSNLALLEGCSLQRIKLTGAKLYNCTIKNSEIRAAQMIQTDFNRSFIRATMIAGSSLIGASLKYVNMVDVIISGTDLQLSNFSYSHLDDTRFMESVLLGSDFSSVRLFRTSFGGADMSLSNMTGSGPQAACQAFGCR